MILLIPILFFQLAVFFYFRLQVRSIRSSLVLASVCFFFTIGVGTEALGYFNQISPSGILIFWLSANLILSGLLFNLLKRFNFNRFLTVRRQIETMYRKLGFTTVVILAFVLLCSLMVCIVATPNNSDSLSYHLSRAGYWLQNRNVEHYASHIERSISMAPLSEYVHLHIFALSSSMQLTQLLQWSCLVGILAIISMIVEKLSPSVMSLRLSLIFAATVPMAILESMTTQNDLLASFMVATFAWLVFDYVDNPQFPTLIFLAIVTGLGIMSKGTFMFYFLPFGLYMIFLLVKHRAWKEIIYTGVSTLAIIMLLNLPFWYRTYMVFDNPFGKTGGIPANINSLAEYLSSVSKHMFLHVGSVSPGDAYNAWAENKLEQFHHLLNIPLRGNNDSMQFKMNKINFNEDFAHNFASFWVIILTISLIPFVNSTKRTRLFLLLAISAVLVFCFFIAYQHYGSRLHLPFFMIIAPAVGVILSELGRKFSFFLILFLGLQAIPFATMSIMHPLFSTKWFFETVFPGINQLFHVNLDISKMPYLKKESIFSNNPGKMIWQDEAPNIAKMARAVDSLNITSIGLEMPEAGADYAYQYSFGRPGRSFYHVLVTNPSRKLEDPKCAPQVIISEMRSDSVLVYHKNIYTMAMSNKYQTLYVKTGL